MGAVRVVDIAGERLEIQDVVGLGNGAEERVVGAVPLLLAVETNGRAFGCAASRAEAPVWLAGDDAERSPPPPLWRTVKLRVP